MGGEGPGDNKGTAKYLMRLKILALGMLLSEPLENNRRVHDCGQSARPTITSAEASA